MFFCPRSQLAIVQLKVKITSVAYQQAVLSHVMLDTRTVIQCAHPAHKLTNARVCIKINSHCYVKQSFGRNVATYLPSVNDTDEAK